MANKKVIKKKSNRKNKKNEKVIEENSVFETNYKQVLLITGIIVIVFAVFYFITVYITGQDTNKPTKKNDSTISYSEIMVGRSFDMPEEEYYVLYYDRSDEELLSSFSTLVSDYRGNPESLAIYTADMSDAINKGYSGDKSNWGPKNISELVIDGPTLIHFKKGKVKEYFEGKKDILSQLQIKE